MRGLILAAGLGERLRPLTARRAKPAIEFLNTPMLAFPYYWLRSMGLTELTFNTHHLPETVRQAAMHVVDPGMPMHFTHEPQILGSGGGIWNARFHLQGDENFAVANGDGVILCEEPDTLERMYDEHVAKKALATLLVCPLEGVGERIPGVWAGAGNEVHGFGLKAPQANTVCLHFASYMIFNKRIWDYIPKGPSNILYDVCLRAMKNGERVQAYKVDRMRWFETGNAQDFLNATETCLRELRDQTRLGQGLARLLKACAPPYGEKSNLERLHLVADTADIAPSARLDGFQVIGADANVAEYARLSSCVVLPSTKVEASATHRFEILS